MTKDESLDLALEALEGIHPGNMTPMAEEYWNKAITAIKQARSAPVQEPVACVIDGDLYFHHEIDWEDLAYQGHGVELLYTTPPAQRPFVGLTDEEMSEVYNQADWDTVNGWEYERAIEAKLRSKNNG